MGVQMMDHVERMKDGLEKIQDGLSQFNGGPASFTVDVLFAAYHTLITQYAPFKVHQRVELAAAPTLKKDQGWWHCRHFLVPGNLATVEHVSCDSDGSLRFDVVFDRETWIDQNGEEQPVISKHMFSFFAHELTGYVEVLR